MDILNQLGGLFVSAAPTVIIVFLFYLFLRWSFFGPMTRVLKERHTRAEGARKQAENERALAQENFRAYNDAMRHARAEIFAEQESVRRKAMEERQSAVQQARSASQQELQAAKMTLAREVEASLAQLEQSSGALAEQIAAAILNAPPGDSRDSSGQGVQ